MKLFYILPYVIFIFVYICVNRNIGNMIRRKCMKKSTRNVMIAGSAILGIAIVAGVMHIVPSQQKNSDEKVSSLSSQSSNKSSSKAQPKGNIKSIELKEQPTLSASVIAQYAADNIKDSSWKSVKTTIDKKESLNLWVVLDDKGASYHYGDVEDSPYYRLSQDGDIVVYYNSNDKKLQEESLNNLVTSVNKKHSTKDINNLKNKVTVTMAESKSKSPVFEKISKKYIFQSGSGSGGTAHIIISSDGTFEGASHSYLGRDAYNSEFQGTLSDLKSIGELVYEGTVQKLDYTPESFTDGGGTKMNLNMIKPNVIAQGDRVRIYLSGYNDKSQFTQEHIVGLFETPETPLKSDVLTITSTGLTRAFLESKQ